MYGQPGEYDDESQKVIAQNTIQKAVDNTVNKNIDEKEAALPSNIGQKDIYYRYTKEKKYHGYHMLLCLQLLRY